MGHTPQESIGGVLMSLSRPWAYRWINDWSLWRQCDARPTVTFPAAGHHHPLTGTKLYCLVTEARVCVYNLPKVVNWKWNGRESNTRPFVSRANTITITPRGHSKTWPVVTNVAWFFCVSVCWTQPWACKNSWTDRDTFWGVNFGGLAQGTIRWGPDPLRGRCNLGVPLRLLLLLLLLLKTSIIIVP